MSERVDAIGEVSGDRTKGKVDLERARWASMTVFFLAGALNATWGVHIPTVRDKFGLNPADLSAALLAVAMGSTIPMFLCGRLVTRLGARKSSAVAGTLLAAATVGVLMAPTIDWLFADLAVLGFSLASLDIAMNAEATAVERALQKPVMSAMHGMFSVGGFTGALLGSLFIGMHIPARGQVVLVSCVCLVLLMRSVRAYLAAESQEAGNSQGSATQRWRCKGLWTLGGLSFVAMLAEGGVYDWATVFMRDIVQVDHAFSTMGYAAFTGGMAIARFGGDKLRSRLGAKRMLAMSSVLALGGAIIALYSGYPTTSILGFLLVGLGFANALPVLFAAAANIEHVPPAQGIAHVAGLAYFGLLAGPVVIGRVAQAVSLTAAMSVIVLCAFVLLLVAPAVIARMRI